MQIMMLINVQHLTLKPLAVLLSSSWQTWSFLHRPLCKLCRKRQAQKYIACFVHLFLIVKNLIEVNFIRFEFHKYIFYILGDLFAVHQ